MWDSCLRRSRLPGSPLHRADAPEIEEGAGCSRKGKEGGAQVAKIPPPTLPVLHTPLSSSNFLNLADWQREEQGLETSSFPLGRRHNASLNLHISEQLPLAHSGQASPPSIAQNFSPPVIACKAQVASLSFSSQAASKRGRSEENILEARIKTVTPNWESLTCEEAGQVPSWENAWHRGSSGSSTCSQGLRHSGPEGVEFRWST